MEWLGYRIDTDNRICRRLKKISLQDDMKKANLSIKRQNQTDSKTNVNDGMFR